MMCFDLQKGFLVVIIKCLVFKLVVGELCGFLCVICSVVDFCVLGCKVWDQNVNENVDWLVNLFCIGIDDLGLVYGVQWCEWLVYKLIDVVYIVQIDVVCVKGFVIVFLLQDNGVEKVLFYKVVDQLCECLDIIVKNFGSCCILFYGWNCVVLDEIVLFVCYLLYQFLFNQSIGEILFCLYVCSNDIGLGMFFNLVEGVVLLYLVVCLIGYKLCWFSYFVGDVYIYENYIDMVKEQLMCEFYLLL